MFGKPVEGDQVQHWGARAIYQGFKDDCHIDLLHDRQTATNEDVSKEKSEAFAYWLNNRGLLELQRQLKEQCLDTDSGDTVSVTEYNYHIEASPNKSFGYLYVGAVERPVAEAKSRHNEAFQWDERVFVVGDASYVWDNQIDPPLPGTEGKHGDLGPGTVVGYSSDDYVESYRLLCLLVKLDDPPEEWLEFAEKREALKWTLNLGKWGITDLVTRKYQGEFRTLDRKRNNQQIENEEYEDQMDEMIRRIGPKHLLRKDTYQTFKEQYKVPPARIYDSFPRHGNRKDTPQS